MAGTTVVAAERRRTKKVNEETQENTAQAQWLLLTPMITSHVLQSLMSLCPRDVFRIAELAN